MRILRCVRSVNRGGGGPIEGLLQMSQLHLQQGHEVEVLSLDGSSDPCVAECPLPVNAIGATSAGYGFSRQWDRWLRANHQRFDAVVVHGLWQYQSFGTWRALRHTTTPYFVFAHGMLDPWFKHAYPLKHIKQWLYWPWAEYRVLRDARAVFFTCEEERRLARESFWLYRSEERVVNYGTSSPGGDPAKQREAFYAVAPQLRDKRLILFLGRIHEKKGCDVIIEAFQRVMQSGTPSTRDLRLVIAGPDPDGWSIKLQRLAQRLGVADQICWPGMLTGDVKWGAFPAAEIFALPSHQENFGIPVVEALACALPVLITDKVNIWREIESDGAGLIGEDNVAGFAPVIRRWLYMSEHKRALFRAAAQRWFELRFDLAGTASRFIDTLQSLIPSCAPRP